MHHVFISSSSLHAWVSWLILVLFILLSYCVFAKVEDKVITTLVSILYFLKQFNVSINF